VSVGREQMRVHDRQASCFKARVFEEESRVLNAYDTFPTGVARVDLGDIAIQWRTAA